MGGGGTGELAVLCRVHGLGADAVKRGGLKRPERNLLGNEPLGRAADRRLGHQSLLDCVCDAGVARAAVHVEAALDTVRRCL